MTTYTAPCRSYARAFSVRSLLTRSATAPRLTPPTSRAHDIGADYPRCQWARCLRDTLTRDEPGTAHRVDLDTDTAAAALAIAPRTAREILATVAARTGRSGSRPSGKRRARTIPVADLAAHYGLAPEDLLLAARLAAP